MKKQHHLPTYDEIKSGIDELLLIDNWDKYKIKRSPEKFSKRLHKLFTSKLGLLPTIIAPWTTNELPFKFYRLRKKDRNMNSSLISEYSYPPIEVMKYTQRANLPFHPVFYCSDQPITAIFESIRTEKKIDPNQEYYLSEWEFKPSQNLRVSPFLFDNLDDSSPYKFMEETSKQALDKILDKNYPKDQCDGFRRIMNLLSHLFIYENTYSVSSFISHYHLYANHNLRSDVFIYPSWQTKKKSINFAIHPNAVSEKMKLNKIYRLKIDDFQFEKQNCTFSVDCIGTNVDSIIQWKMVDSDTPLF